MHRLAKSTTTTTLLRTLHSSNPSPFSLLNHHHRRLSTSSGNKNKNDEWNAAWETAWLPDDLSGKNTRAPWESDVNFGLTHDSAADADAETKAFVEDMNENWEHRRKNKDKLKREEEVKKEDGENGGGLYSLENVKRDYRLKKQRIHAGLWMKEIELLEEAKLGGGSGDDIDRLLDSCSEIFDSASNNLNDPKVPGTSEYKNKPDGWESTSKSEDGNVWDMSQREEDILLQEFERRMAFCKFQIASFIKTHIFSRRRPIDGWRYMIEVIGPNARKGKGSVSRLPGLADPATRPFTEDRPPTTGVGGRLSRRPR
ncbi:hypothetical protein SOVF_093870 [Spinacia oleracea]|uniref:Protein GAMETE CELL DEFECTIVE 1, mitochondrial n=1 Tax=Spinacia oleracea TaxID=3562 RepID=A0A9R0JH67_SPIOL|nr:protein GAMETE CELL DEFECTIVE 1, mitochondrial [Spinacia oleracea]KNA15913.1 hypothetical protein SOVF_093870 [Spinacia oleracea]